MLSHYGLARDVAAILDGKLLEQKTVFPESKTETSDLLEIKVENAEACPRYCGRIVRGIKVGDSPDWLKDCSCIAWLKTDK